MGIINLSGKLNDGTLQSPEMCLRDCIDNDIGKARAFKNAKKLIIIALDDTEGEYNTSWNQAGMKSSEIISLLETVKYGFCSELKG